MLYLREYYFKRDIISFQEDDTDLVYRYISISDYLKTCTQYNTTKQFQKSKVRLHEMSQ